MDRRERYFDVTETLRSALEGNQAEIWTALPGIITAFNSDAVTASVQPGIKGKIKTEEGQINSVSLPLLVDVPVVFPRGGDFTLTFPVKAGDECLVVFASRCIDDWWQSGKEGEQIDRRMHDLSDGFALVGPFSQAQKIKDIKTDCAELRLNDGDVSVAVFKDKVKISASKVEIAGELEVQGNIEVKGSLHATGSVTDDD